jgi:DnaJ-class molecular chaperone
MVSSTNTFYDVLEVSPLACPQVIRAAFRCLTQCNHPDKQVDSQSACERQAQINVAYAVLSDPARRKRYDQDLATQPGLIDRRSGNWVAPKRQPMGDNGVKGAPPRSRPFAFRPLP